MDTLERGIDAAARSDWNAAIWAFTEVIEAKHCLPLAYRHRGHSYLKKGEWEKAIADLTKAIVLDHKAANPFANRGYAFLQMGDYTRAISDCTEAIHLDPRFERGLYVSGSVVSGDGRVGASDCRLHAGD